MGTATGRPFGFSESIEYSCSIMKPEIHPRGCEPLSYPCVVKNQQGSLAVSF